MKKFLRAINVICFLFFSINLAAQPVSQTFNASGTYTVPPLYAAIVTIEAWGGGGGGGSNTGAAKGGGGGGAYSIVTPVTLGSGSYTVTVGAGGGPAANGAASSFTTICVASGGGSGTTAGGTGGSTGTGTITAGANGVGGSGNVGGAGGNGGNGGAGGAGGSGEGISGVNGTAPGGGGGGKGSNTACISGTGANGRVVVTVLTILPVKIGSVSAREVLEGTQIEWLVIEEYDVLKYVVERSIDGVAFINIGEASSTGPGSDKKYFFTDLNPEDGLNLYRIRVVNADGSFYYSPVGRIDRKNIVSRLLIYPNPSAGRNVSIYSPVLQKGEYSIGISTIAGQQLFRQKFFHEGGKISRSVSLPDNVKGGSYTLMLITENKIINSVKLIVR